MRHLCLATGLVTLIGIASAAPPTIVSTTPEIGATNVDPATSELTVTFDQRMDSGFSWAGGGEQFPKVPEEKRPSWSKDRKTCTLPIALEPNKAYRLGINSKSFRNFRNMAGEAVTPTLFTFATGAADAESDNADDAVVLLEDSFESGDSTPFGWEDRDIEGVKLTWDKRLAKTGDRSLRLSKTANRYFPIASWAKRVEHKQDQAEALQLTAVVRAKDAKKVVLDVLFLDDDAKWISHEWTSYIGEDDSNPGGVTCDWTEYSGAVAIPEGTAFIELSAQIYGPGMVWVDDIKATYVGKDAVTKK